MEMSAIQHLESAVRHFQSANRHFYSAKWHFNAPTGLCQGGPIPHAFSTCVLCFQVVLKDIFFVCDHETLSYSATNSLKLIYTWLKTRVAYFGICKQISTSRLARHNNQKQELSMASNKKFSHSTIHDINRWVRNFDFSTKTNFTDYKLEEIKALRNVKIKWDFLHAAVKFWDTEDHVFWFQTAELCPTIEEFSAILGYDPSKKFVEGFL